MPVFNRLFVVVSLMVSLAAMPLAANAQEKAYTLQQYERQLAAEAPDLDLRSPLFWMHLGMASGIQTVREEYLRIGQKPLFCLTSDLAPWLSYGFVRHAIADELKLRGDFWRRQPEALVGTVLIEAMRRQNPCTAAIQPAPLVLQLSFNDFRRLRDNAERGDKGSLQILIWFFLGLRSGLTASIDAYAAQGARKLFCPPAAIASVDIAMAIDEEIERDKAFLDSRKDEDVGVVAPQALARKWPCK